MNNYLLGAFVLFFLLMSLREWVELLRLSPFVKWSVILLIGGWFLTTDFAAKIAKAVKTAATVGVIAVAVAVAVCLIAAICDPYIKKER